MSSAQCFLRPSKGYTVHFGPTYQELIDLFHIYADIFLCLLVEHDVEFVVMSNLPHEGPDILLYRIAKKLNIPVLMLMQSLIPNRMFYTYDLDSFGDWSDYPILHPHEHIAIPHSHRKDLFYMRNVRQRIGSRRGFRTPQWLQILYRIILRGVFPRNRRKLKNRIVLKTVDEVTSRRAHSLAINKRLAVLNDLPNDFVYFPLHLQPELTTAALGGGFSDQILAVEELRRLVPEHVAIIVKENPKQGPYARGAWFYERLSRIPATYLVSSDMDTYELIEKCTFVATVTGTAGWEAISGGKNVLVFGKAWYRQLPGVIEYRKAQDSDASPVQPFDHHALEAALSDLVSRLPIGVIDTNYAILHAEYRADENAASIARFIAVEIGKSVGQNTSVSMDCVLPKL